MHRTATRTLKIAALLESASLAVLLANLALGNAPGVAAAVGPVHGCLYVFVIIAAARHPLATPASTLRAVVPAVGGLLALRALTTRARSVPLAARAVPPSEETVVGANGGR
jgi:hypothetical protein